MKSNGVQMMKIRRPYIPLAIRVQVAERQTKVKFDDSCITRPSLKDQLKGLLYCLFGDAKVELHHRPALVNRVKRIVGAKTIYFPDANDPAHLIYVLKDDHNVETRVRGIGAQRSDLGQRRYNKKVTKNRLRDPKRPSRWPQGRKVYFRPINARWRRKRWAKAEEGGLGRKTL
jgi:hypothetical protein